EQNGGARPADRSKCETEIHPITSSDRGTVSTAFKGPISPGTIKAEFASDYSNADSDLLVVSTAMIGGGNPQVAKDIAAPGGFASVSIDAVAPGVLEVWVAIGTRTDSGRLRVTSDDTLMHDAPISKSVRWVYSVEA